VDMPDVAIHDADEEPGVNTEPMATVNNVVRNTLADDTEDNDGISQLLRNVETECLSERQLRKLEKIRQDGKTPLYRNCPMSKLAVKWVFKPAVMSRSGVVAAISRYSCA